MTSSPAGGGAISPAAGGAISPGGGGAMGVVPGGVAAAAAPAAGGAGFAVGGAEPPRDAANTASRICTRAPEGTRPFTTVYRSRQARWASGVRKLSSSTWGRVALERPPTTTPSRRARRTLSQSTFFPVITVDDGTQPIRPQMAEESWRSRVWFRGPLSGRTAMRALAGTAARTATSVARRGAESVGVRRIRRPSLSRDPAIHHCELLRPPPSPRCSPGAEGRRARLDAVSTSAMWLKACGKLPTSRRARGSYSSLRRPTSLRRRGAARRALSPRRAGRAWRASPRARSCREEGPFSRREAVHGRVVGAVAEDEAIVDQLALDRLHRAHHPRVLRGRKPTWGMRSRLASRASLP